MEFKLVINNKGRAGSKEIKDTECNVFLNKKVGDSVKVRVFRDGQTLDFTATLGEASGE